MMGVQGFVLKRLRLTGPKECQTRRGRLGGHYGSDGFRAAGFQCQIDSFSFVTEWRLIIHCLSFVSGTPSTPKAAKPS
jgi:hypothetical protein